VYAPNYRQQRAGPLFAPEYAEAIGKAPIYCSKDVEQLAAFIRKSVGKGRGLEVIERIWRDGNGPAKILQQVVPQIIRRQNVFTLLDEQIPALLSILSALEVAATRKRKTLILIEGGPGTGKSVIAVEAFAEALRRERNVFVVSGSSAFTNGMRRLVGTRLARRINFTDFFRKHRENALDLLIIDEAHRIRAQSPSSDRKQLEELVRAAKVIALFMDVNQSIDPDEVGNPRDVKNLAGRHVRFKHHPLQAQFRCNGSDEYLHWCDNLFGLESAAPRLQVPAEFDFDVLDSPHDVLAWVREKNAVAPNTARLVAGWCWPWSKPRKDGTLVKDIRIGDFAFPWERQSRTKAKRGIPEARWWAIHPGGTRQAGTVYSVQGFEFPYVGILMGPDLISRKGSWLATPQANFRRSLRKLPPEVASLYFRRIYRTLFTRARLGVRVFSVDDKTRNFIRSRLTVKRQPLITLGSRSK
jgi:DUF2075 family protein